MAPATQTIAHDRFFSGRNRKLQLAQIVVAIVFWIAFLAAPEMLINSLHPTIPWLHHWNHQEGRDFFHFMLVASVVSFVVMLVCSLLLALRNDRREQRVFATRKTYDEAALTQRQALLEQLYVEHFGDRGQRENAQSIEILPSQNFGDKELVELFERNHLLMNK